jgi:hypothetical protein
MSSSPPTTVPLLHNEPPTQNHWLTLKLVGHKINRDGIGAEIKLTTSPVALTHPCGTLSIALSPLSGPTWGDYDRDGLYELARNLRVRRSLALDE